VTLGNATDGWVAGHLRDEVEVHGDHGGLEAEARTRPGRLASRMAGAHHDDIELLRHPLSLYR
jgi:hypothetical protein